jgi:MFS family permease
MVCNDKWKVQLLNMMMFIGCLIGAALFGHLNDTMGRKKPLLLAQLSCVVAVFVSAAAPPGGYWFMAFVRMAMGVAAAGQNQCVAVLNAEIAGKSRRWVGVVWCRKQQVAAALCTTAAASAKAGCCSCLCDVLLWQHVRSLLYQHEYSA